MTEKAMEFALKELDRKLKSLMSEREYTTYMRGVAKDVFRIEVSEMQDGEFKRFTLEHFGEIVGDDNDM